MQIIDQLIMTASKSAEIGGDGEQERPGTGLGFDEAYGNTDTATHDLSDVVDQVEDKAAPTSGEPAAEEMNFADLAAIPSPLAPARQAKNQPALEPGTPVVSELPSEQQGGADRLPNAEKEKVMPAGEPIEIPEPSPNNDRSAGSAKVEELPDRSFPKTAAAQHQGTQSAWHTGSEQHALASSQNSGKTGTLTPPTERKMRPNDGSPEVPTDSAKNGTQRLPQSDAGQPVTTALHGPGNHTGQTSRNASYDTPGQEIPIPASVPVFRRTESFERHPVRTPPLPQEPFNNARLGSDPSVVQHAESAWAKTISVQSAPATSQPDALEAAPLTAVESLQAELRAVSRPDAARTGPVPASGAVTQSVSSQILATITGAGDGKIEVHLRPAELGRVTVQLNPTENGLSAIISAERPEVSELLRRNGEIFRRDLADMGYTNISLEFEANDDGGHLGPSRFMHIDGSHLEDNAPEDTVLSIARPAKALANGLDIRI